MKTSLFFAACSCLLVVGTQVRSQDKETERDQALAVIKTLKGKFTLDDKADGKPVVKVSLHDCEATDKDLAALKGLVFVKSLDLGHCKITNAGLVHLKGMVRLEKLVLHDAKVGDAGLVHLKGLTSLKTLDVGDTDVTDAGVKELQKALPKLKIIKSKD
jgi:hypothetical protein